MRALCSGVIETMGRVEYDGKVKHPVTAHPKVDPDTGESHARQPVVSFSACHATSGPSSS